MPIVGIPHMVIDSGWRWQFPAALSVLLRGYTAPCSIQRISESNFGAWPRG
jgi:hypothetical protein